MFGAILSVAFLMGGGEDDKREPVVGVIDTVKFTPNHKNPWFIQFTLINDKEVYKVSGAKVTLDGKKVTMSEFIKWLAENHSPKVKIYFDGYLGKIDRIEATSPPPDPDEKEKK